MSARSLRRFARPGLPGARTVLLLASLAVAACNNDTTDPRTPTAIAVVSGDLQSAAAGATLSSAFVVSVTDQDGQALSDVTVTWAIGAGGGSLSTSSSVTSADGQAQATYTTGTDAGTATITATVSGLTAVTFSVTITGETQ